MGATESNLEGVFENNAPSKPLTNHQRIKLHFRKSVELAIRQFMLKEKNAPNIELDKEQLDKFCSHVVKFQDVQIIEHQYPTKMITSSSPSNTTAVSKSNDISTSPDNQPSEAKPDTWSEFTVTVSVDSDYIITVAIAELLEEAKYAIGGGVGGGVAGAGTGAGLGAGIGALVGVIGGPVGMVAGAHIGAAIGAAAGGATGAGAGVTAGVMKSKQRENISARDIFKHIPNGRIVSENVKNRDEKIIQLVYSGELKWGDQAEDVQSEVKSVEVVSQQKTSAQEDNEGRDDETALKEQKVLNFTPAVHTDEDKDTKASDPQTTSENREPQNDGVNSESAPQEEDLKTGTKKAGADDKTADNKTGIDEDHDQAEESHVSENNTVGTVDQ